MHPLREERCFSVGGARRRCRGPRRRVVIVIWFGAFPGVPAPVAAALLWTVSEDEYTLMRGTEDKTMSERQITPSVGRCHGGDCTNNNTLL